jgi:methylenetetrahydrofolate reductase (NADPH)
MNIRDIFAKKKITYSFEFFPPKDSLDALALGETIGELRHLGPDFISVTYGAGGSTQRLTFDVCDYLQNRLGINAMAHFTCVGATEEQLATGMKELQSKGIHNLMLLRGDPPKGQTSFQQTQGGFAQAADLIRLGRKLGDFAIGVAGYPEKHVEAVSAEKDLEFLKAKIDAGGDFVVTQLFFDNAHYFRFVESARKLGITARIIPGIMPVANFKQIKRIATMCGVELPAPFLSKLEKVQDDAKAMTVAGIEYAAKQCRELIDGGAPGIHFYTLNKSHATMEIYKAMMK